jgi:hypothetical protein
VTTGAATGVATGAATGGTTGAATGVTTRPAGTGTTATDGAAGAATGVATTNGANGALLQALTSRQRIPLTVDPFGQSGVKISPALAEDRIQAVGNLFTGMQELHLSLTGVLGELEARTAPPQLIGVLLQPDGTAAGLVQVSFEPSTLGSSSPTVTVQTDESGTFELAMPANLKLPAGSEVTLLIHGASSNATIKLPSEQIAPNGLLGSLRLATYIAPLPVSIVAALEALVPPATKPNTTPPLTNPAQLPVVSLGDCQDCLLHYGANGSEDTFPYGVFFRLIEPRASIVSQVRQRIVEGNFSTFLPDYETSFNGNGGAAGEGAVAYVDRIPVEQPLSVDGFRDQLAGLQPNGTFTGDETWPMAGTLGLGYVLWMSQRWTLQGLALGDLVYSLPLAPGEQQEVAVFERLDTAQVSETEFFTEEQAQQQRAVADTSTQATFNSAFTEAVHGSSEFESEGHSWSVGGSLFGLVSAGGGGSSSSGNSHQALEGQRESTQRAAQLTHSAAENQASARRNAAHTGMRLASASESESVTTKVVTNHNHAHALTMQYWEVDRLYDVTTAIDGLTLTVLVPLQVVRFMPPNQPATLYSPELVERREQVIARYSTIARHGDVLRQAVPRRFQRGLSMLLQFVSDPTAEVEPYGGTAEDVIRFTITGSFLPCEDVYVSAVTESGSRVGPVRLANDAPAIPDETFASEEHLIAWLEEQRQMGSVRCEGALALPTTMNRANIVGFEISRSFRQVNYTLLSPAQAELQQLEKQIGSNTNWITQFLESTLTAGAGPATTVSLAPAQLENELGGPHLSDFQAAIEELDSEGAAVPSATEQYANGSLVGVELPPQPYPVPARQLAPRLRYNEILEIEELAEHVVRNTLIYSRAIWASMNAEERAILLEAYTIGVPPGGVEDATQMVPLLNCVENRVLGFFGNSMIMPFFMPQALAEQKAAGASAENAGAEVAKINEALLAYQTTGFTPPKSIVALPTRGVLGEAVLGQCPSAEKIDITRFWNWQDSPADTAPAISPSTLPTTTPSIATGETGPNTLQNLPSLINNVLTAPTPESALLQTLAKEAAGQKPFQNITGAEQLAGLLNNAQTTSNAAREGALKTTKELQAQAMATVANLIGGKKEENPEAGSKALSALTGKGGGEGGEEKKKKEEEAKKKMEEEAKKKGTGTGTGTSPGPGTGPGGATGGKTAGLGELGGAEGLLAEAGAAEGLGALAGALIGAVAPAPSPPPSQKKGENGGSS